MVRSRSALAMVTCTLMALGSGVLADALDRRKLMLFSQIAMMFCSASLALASSLGFVSIWLIYAVTALSSEQGLRDHAGRY